MRANEREVGLVQQADLPASQRFYSAIFDVLGVPMGGTGTDFFWVDELFVSTADSRAAQGRLTGRHHLAFQAKDRAMVEAVADAIAKVHYANPRLPTFGAIARAALAAVREEVARR